WPPDSNPDQTSTPRLFDAVTGRELMRLEGHKQEITGLAFSPDGTRILTTSYDKTARIWDANTGQELVRLDGHREPVTRAAFSPDGDRVVTISEDNTARLWEVSSGREIARFLGHDKRLNTAAFSSDGRFVVTSSTDKTAQIWDAFIETQELVDIAKNTVQRCLTENEREKFHLTGSVPRWCYTLNKRPFDMWEPSPSWYEKPFAVAGRLFETSKAAPKEGFIGASLSDLTVDRTDRSGLDKPQGVWIDRLDADGPAQQAGIEPGDVVLEVDRTPAVDSQSLSEAIRNHRPGTSVQLTVWHRERRKELRVVVGRRPADLPASMRVERDPAAAAKKADELWVSVYVDRGKRLLDQGKDEDAKLQFALALQRDVGAARKIDELWSNTYFERGKKLLNEEKDEEANSQFALALH